MDHILVTGAAGMIGSHLIDVLLAKGMFVFALHESVEGSPVRKNCHKLTFIEGSVTDRVLMEHIVPRVDAVVHLEGLKSRSSFSNSRSKLRFVCESTDIILGIAYRFHKRVLLASASDCNEHRRFSEPCGRGPMSDSSVDKMCLAYANAQSYMEHLALDYAHDGLDIRVVRYFGAFSERCSVTSCNNLIHTFIRRAAIREPIEIYGDGSSNQFVTYGADLAHGSYLALAKDGVQGGFFDIGGTEKMSVTNMALRISELTGWESPEIIYISDIQNSEIEGETKCRQPCLDKARVSLGYVPQWSFDTAITHIIQSCEVLSGGGASV